MRRPGWYYGREASSTSESCSSSENTDDDEGDDDVNEKNKKKKKKNEKNPNRHVPGCFSARPWRRRRAVFELDYREITER